MRGGKGEGPDGVKSPVFFLLAPSFHYQTETNKPLIDMKKIASACLLAALGTNLAPAQDVGKKNNAEEVMVEVLAETSCSWDGAMLPNYPTTTPKITILRYKFPAHQRLSLHTHSIINCGAMLKGELTIVTKDGRERTFKKGDAVMEMIGTVHYGENRGDEDAEVIMFYAGTEGLPLKEEAK